MFYGYRIAEQTKIMFCGTDHLDGSSYSQEAAFETVTVDVSQVHHLPPHRKPAEPPSYTSKAVGKYKIDFIFISKLSF